MVSKANEDLPEPLSPVKQIMELPERTKIQLLAPVVRGRKGTHAKLFEREKKNGYVRVLVDGNLYGLLKEKLLGSISSILIPQSGQEKL